MGETMVQAGNQAGHVESKVHTRLKRLGTRSGTGSLARAICGVSLLALLGAGGVSHAQNYPTKPVTIYYPYQVGGGGDGVLRAINGYLEKKWGQPIVIEARPGGNEVVSMSALLNANPDGHQIGVTSQNFSLNPAVQKLPYDSAKEFTIVAPFSQFSSILGVQPDLPIRTVAEFVAYAKANPGKINFGFLGNHHKVTLTQFQDIGKFTVTEIPYKGSPDVNAAFLGGSIQAFFFTGTQGDAYAKDGKLRYVATTPSARTAAWPNLPTLSETFPGLQMAYWLGIVTKSSTPKAVQDKWSAGIKEAQAQPEVQQAYKNLGFAPWWIAQDEMAAYVKREVESLGRGAKMAGLTPQ